jgi:hypothetical protein
MNKRIFIIMWEQSKIKQIEKLYRDAFYNNLSREDTSDYQKEVEMLRRKARFEEV